MGNKHGHKLDRKGRWCGVLISPFSIHRIRSCGTVFFLIFFISSSSTVVPISASQQYVETTNFNEPEVQSLHGYFNDIAKNKVKKELVIDRNIFKAALGLKESLFINRMFLMFDTGKKHQRSAHNRHHNACLSCLSVVVCVVARLFYWLVPVLLFV